MPKTEDIPPTLPKQRAYLYVTALIWIIIFMFIGLNIRTIYQNRDIYIKSAIIGSKTKAQLLGENTSNKLYTLDLTFSSILQQIKTTDTRHIENQIAPVLKHAAAFLPQIDTFFLLNHDNQQIYPATPEQMISISCLDGHKKARRKFCFSTRSDPPKNKQIIISRRIENAKGQFKGVIAASIKPSFLSERQENYRNLGLQSVALLDAQQGVLVSWHNTIPENIQTEKSTPRQSLWQLPMPTIKNGGLATHETPDSIISIYQLAGFPLQIAVTLEKQQILKQWHPHKNYLLSACILSVFIGIATMFFVARQRSKKENAECELINHQLKLEETINERTLNMQQANEKLQSEITERLQMESKLRESEQRYKQIYDSISDCLIISNLKGWIIDVNPASCKAYGYAREELIGSHFTRIVHKDYHSNFQQYEKDLISIGQYSGDVIAVKKNGRLINTIVKGNLYVSQGQQRVLGVIRDVTKEKQNKQQREELITELQNALEEIKTLEGIVPICAHCKKIRDDKGYWNLLETYIEKHSDASFSHGICPECSEEMYGEQAWYIKMKEEKPPDSS